MRATVAPCRSLPLAIRAVRVSRFYGYLCGHLAAQFGGIHFTVLHRCKGLDFDVSILFNIHNYGFLVDFRAVLFADQYLHTLSPSPRNGASNLVFIVIARVSVEKVNLVIAVCRNVNYLANIPVRIDLGFHHVPLDNPRTLVRLLGHKFATGLAGNVFRGTFRAGRNLARRLEKRLWFLNNGMFPAQDCGPVFGIHRLHGGRTSESRFRSSGFVSNISIQKLGGQIFQERSREESKVCVTVHTVPHH
mmetsp:Transcript_12908/g.24827  ORF Transcript_12908/g.24827 Transcript_12908/m.24827 type:complete len:247 (+) Transcript_12908:38-778(+)